MSWRIEYLSQVPGDDISALPRTMAKRIRAAVEQRLMLDPVSYGKPLRYSLRGHRRLRVGDYRIVYRVIEEQKIVLITAIKHRKDVYED